VKSVVHWRAKMPAVGNTHLNAAVSRQNVSCHLPCKKSWV
jgi:hypothetical protein